MLLLKLITALHVLVALFMILVVLLQGGSSGGVSATFGGGNSSGVFGATGATSILTKLTYVAAIIFMFTSLSLSMIQSNSGSTGIFDKVKNSSESVPGGVLDHLDPTKASTTDEVSSQPEASKEEPAAATTTAEPSGKVDSKQDKSTSTQEKAQTKDSKPSSEAKKSN